MAAEDSASIRNDRFNGENFHLWKFKVQMVLEDKELWGIVSGDERGPVGTYVTEAQKERYRKQARKTLATICLSLGDNQLSLVRSSQNAQEAGNRLEDHHQVKSLANKLFLGKRYFSMTMDE